MCDLVFRRTYEDHGPADGEDPLQLARHNQALPRLAQADQVNVCRRQACRELLSGNVVEELEPSAGFRGREGLHLGASRSAAREGPHRPSLAEQPGRFEKLGEAMPKAHVPRVHQHQVAFAPAALRSQLVHLLGRDGRALAPERHRRQSSCPGGIARHGLLHEGAQRQHQVRAAQLPT